MKILAFSGMHQDNELLDIFLTSIKRKDLTPDVFISAGDMGDEIHFEVFNRLSKLKKPIAFVGGNWELDPNVLKKTARIPNVYHISEENLVVDDYIWVCDETHRKPLCVGKALLSGEEMKQGSSGKAIKNIHYIGDKLWKLSQP